jgi:hypothetical protein
MEGYGKFCALILPDKSSGIPKYICVDLQSPVSIELGLYHSASFTGTRSRKNMFAVQLES